MRLNSFFSRGRTYFNLEKNLLHQLVESSHFHNFFILNLYPEGQNLEAQEAGHTFSCLPDTYSMDPILSCRNSHILLSALSLFQKQKHQLTRC